MRQLKVSIRMAKARYETRHNRRLTMQELADKVGVTRNTIQRWARGDVDGFKLGTLELLCRTLECDVYDVMWMEDSPDLEPEYE